MIRWSLSKATPVAETPYSWLYRAEQTGRKPAALKLLKPSAGPGERRGAALLAWYGGEGAPAVFESTDDAVFMEWLDGASLAEPAKAGHDQEATIAIAQLVTQLHQLRPEPPKSLLPLREHFEALFKAVRGNWPGRARDLFARSIGIAHNLFDRPPQPVPLHGDLQHHNILSADRGWLAIDPKGLLGDPVYEIAPAFMAPQDATKLVSDPARIARLADTFAQRLSFPRKRILGFAAAHAALSACWELEAGRPVTLQLAVLPHLLAAYDLSA